MNQEDKPAPGRAGPAVGHRKAEDLEGKARAIDQAMAFRRAFERAADRLGLDSK